MSAPFTLLVLAGPGHAAFALPRILAFARQLSATVELHALIHDPRCDAASGMPAHERQLLQKHLLAEAHTALQAQCQPLRHQGHALHCAVSWTDEPVRWLTDRLREPGDHMLVKTAQPERHGLRLPTDWQLLRTLECPLWLIHPLARPHAACVCAAINAGHADTDQETLDIAVLRWAADYARAMGHALHAAYVQPLPSALLDLDLIDKQACRQRALEEAQQALERRVAAAGLPLPVDLQALAGEPQRGLLGLIGKLKPDLVVMGNHAHKHLSGLLRGNTAEQLLPVLGTDLLVLPRRAPRHLPGSSVSAAHRPEVTGITR